MDKEDIFRAGVELLLWRKKLEAFLEGDKSIHRKDLVSYSECPVGKWIYSEEMAKYRSMTEVREFKKIHRQVHEIARKIIDYSDKDSLIDVKDEFAQLEELSQVLITLLTALEHTIQSS